MADLFSYLKFKIHTRLTALTELDEIHSTVYAVTSRKVILLGTAILSFREYIQFMLQMQSKSWYSKCSKHMRPI